MDVVRQTASSYSLKISGDTVKSRYVTIEGPQPAAPAPTAAQLAQQAIQNATLVVHQYRLKYADAAQLAPVLQSLFTGAGTQGANGALPTGTGRGALPGTVVVGGNGPATGAVAAKVAVDVSQANAASQGLSVMRMVDASGNSSVVTSGNIAGAPQAMQAMLAQLQAGGATGAGSLSAASQLVRIVAEETSNSLLVRSTEADWNVIKALLSGM